MVRMTGVIIQTHLRVVFHEFHTLKGGLRRVTNWKTGICRSRLTWSLHTFFIVSVSKVARYPDSQSILRIALYADTFSAMKFVWFSVSVRLEMNDVRVLHDCRGQCRYWLCQRRPSK